MVRNCSLGWLTVAVQLPMPRGYAYGVLRIGLSKKSLFIATFERFDVFDHSLAPHPYRCAQRQQDASVDFTNKTRRSDSADAENEKCVERYQSQE
jgi:hypothetical protein